MMKGKLILVGAGPGDPDLITVKGIKALAQADVLLYDALANKELLSHTREGCKQIFVGKRPNVHRTQQKEINELIVKYTLVGKIVVRLKGGDPYVFGRGHEEEVYVASHGIETEVIPGVSSFYSVPAVNHLPLTRRGLSESFWVLTGTTRDLSIAKDIKMAARSHATVVILMGMSKLGQICQIFREEGNKHQLVTIIQNGTLPNQKIVSGTIETIEELVQKEKMTNPSIIVIGQVNEVLSDASL